MMESNSRGNSLSVIFLILGSTLLLHCCDAAPHLRRARNAAPEPRCPNCPRDCPENLPGGSIPAENEQYPVLVQQQYQPQPASQVITVDQAYYNQPPPQAQATPASADPLYYNQAPPAPSPPQTQYYQQLPPSPPIQPQPVEQPYYTQPIAPPPPRAPVQPCYNRPPGQQPPNGYIGSPRSRPGKPYNPWGQSHLPFRNLNDDPYNDMDYRSRYYNGDGSAGCDCEPKLYLDDLEDEDDVAFSKYHRRSLDGLTRVSRQYNYRDHGNVRDPLNSPINMYRTYRPYRQVSRGDITDETKSNENDHRDRERLYVVYRADAFKDDQGSGNPSNQELQSVIRKAIDIVRDQRIQDNAMLIRPDNRYRYNNDIQTLRGPNEQMEFQGLYQPGYQNPQVKQHQVNYNDRYDLTPGQIMDSEDHYVIHEDGDEFNNPGWDQSKWTAIPAASNGAFEMQVEGNQAQVTENDGNAENARMLDNAELGDKTETKIVEDIKTQKEQGLIEDMEAPQIVTETTNFERLSESTTNKK